MINFSKVSLAGSVVVNSLICGGVGFVPLAVIASPSSENPTLLSQAQRYQETFACGDSAVTISESASNRYTYKATNARGRTLTIRNGTTHSGRNYSSIFVFHNTDGTEYVLEDFGGGKAALSVGSYPDSSSNTECTTDGNP